MEIENWKICYLNIKTLSIDVLQNIIGYEKRKSVTYIF